MFAPPNTNGIVPFQQLTQPTMAPYAPGGVQAPDIQPIKSGGMFGGMGDGARLAIAAGLAGLVSRRNPQLAESMMQPIMMQRQMAMQMAHIAAQNQFEYQRQLALHQNEVDNPVPGENERMLKRYMDPTTPAAEKAAIGSLIMHPMGVDVTMPDGSVQRQYVYPGSLPGAPGASPPAGPVGKLTPIGGQTPQASGGFR